MSMRRFLPLPAWLMFLSVSAVAQDCDVNGTRDSTEIRSGAAEDCNENGIPDVCEFVPLLFGEIGEQPAARGAPQVVSSGDLDGDGLSDVVVGGWEDAEGALSTLNIFFNRGGGEFAPALVIETTNLSALESADLDADGDVDLVTAGGDALRLYANDGGEFGRRLDVATPPGTVGLRVVDIDLDGKPDLVTLNPGEGNVSWYPNLAKGPLDARTFGDALSVSAPELLVPGSSVRSLAAADFDGDSDVDLALAETRDENISILENTQRGMSFPLVRSLPSGDGGMTALHAGDLDGDGRGDLVAVTRRRSVIVWRSLGEEGFGEPAKLKFSADSLVLADINADGALDLVAAGPEPVGGLARVLLGSAGEDGAAGSFMPPQNFTAESDTVVRADDFDGDGDVDLVFANSERTRVLFQGEEDAAVFDKPMRFGAQDRPHWIEVGNFNGDGIPDVLTANSDDRTYSLFFGGGDGSFQFQEVRDVGFQDVRAVAAIDVNQDGVDDAVFSASRFEDARMLIIQNDGSGTLGAVEVTRLPNFHTGTLFKADMDGDGFVDVLVPGGERQVLAVLYIDGEGGFGQTQLLKTSSQPNSAAAGDLDLDGDLDLVTANHNSSDLSILLQESTQESPRSFAPAVTVPLDGTARGVTLGDFDQDGVLDVATVAGDDVTILLNRGDGTLDFALERAALNTRGVVGFGGQGFGFRLSAVDLDGDGLLDLLLTTTIDVAILRGRGDGTFFRPRFIRTGSDVIYSALGVDVDADDDNDIVFGDRTGQNVVVLLNQLAASVPPEEFLGEICTPLDFELVSLPEVGPLSERRTTYFLPAREDPELLETLYVNVARFPLERDFLREVFPKRFGDLTDERFTELALRRATRDYFSGALRRLRLDDGRTAYGFDVRTALVEPDELLSLQETRGVRARLEESFGLRPLVYFPGTPGAREAARDWDAPDFPVVISEEKDPPLAEGNPTFVLEIPADTVLCGVFAVAGGGRGVRDEYELKARVRLREGALMLPTENDTFSGELFAEVLFGPERLTAEAEDTGTFRVVRIPPNVNSDVTTFRFTYSQPFTFPPSAQTPAQTPARLLELEVLSPLVFRARGDEPLTESQTLPEEYFVALKGREPLQAKLDGEPLVRFGSCTYEALPRWGIEAELEDGTVISLEERFEEAASVTETAPASVTRAEVTIGEERRVVMDYFNLVYSAFRHNRAVDYWVIFDEPVTIDAGVVHAVELQALEEDPAFARTAQAVYLGADFEVLSRPSVTRFERAPLPEAFFIRGDAAGDGTLDVLDALQVLRFVFEREATLPCLKAADANDDGQLNIVDAIAVISQLFGRGDALADPFPDCGSDPTEDALSCRSAPPCP
jgi:hypothetical protein